MNPCSRRCPCWLHTGARGCSGPLASASEIRTAPGGRLPALARPARLPALRCAPASVQRAPLSSNAPSQDAPRPPSCSPPPQRRPGLLSSGGVVRAPGAYLHVASLARRPLPVIAASGRVVAPTQSSAWTVAAADTSSSTPANTTLALPAPRADKYSLALPTQCPLSPGPRPRPRPGSAHSPRGLPGPVVSAQSVHTQKPRRSGGPGGVRAACSKDNLYTCGKSLCHF